jgi:HSP20 family protein
MANETLQKEIISMRNNISSLFDNFLSSRHSANPGPENETESLWLPDVDIRETKDEFVLYMALPGVKKEDVQTEIKDNLLAISGKRAVKNDEDDNWLRREIPSGQFYRAFKIGAQVKSDAVKAAFKDSILEIHIPKADAEKPNKIQIE